MRQFVVLSEEVCSKLPSPEDLTASSKDQLEIIYSQLASFATSAQSFITVSYFIRLGFWGSFVVDLQMVDKWDLCAMIWIVYWKQRATRSARVEMRRDTTNKNVFEILIPE